MAPLTADVEEGRARNTIGKITLEYDRDRAGISGVCIEISGIGAQNWAIFRHDRFNGVLNGKQSDQRYSLAGNTE